MKKLALFILFLGLVPLSCEKQEDYPYLVMSGFELTVEQNGAPYQYPELINPSDSLVFRLNPTHRYMAETSFDLFQNEAWANGARGREGVKYKIDSIQVLANYPHHGRPAETNIVDAFYLWYHTANGVQRASIQEAIAHLNASRLNYNTCFLTFKQFPDSMTYRNTFTVRFWLEEQNWFERKTPELVFRN